MQYGSCKVCHQESDMIYPEFNTCKSCIEVSTDVSASSSLWGYYQLVLKISEKRVLQAISNVGKLSLSEEKEIIDLLINLEKLQSNVQEQASKSSVKSDKDGMLNDIDNFKSKILSILYESFPSEPYLVDIDKYRV